MTLLATFKHISSKNADYGAAEAYLTFEHDEFTMKPTLDENGRLIPREDYRISSLNCGGEDFAVACMRANLRYEKNQKREDVKSHHYIISFDPRDGTDNGLTVDRAQELGEQFCKEHFPGHQALVCTHPDGHNHSGNIHVHIVINSLRIYEVPLLPYMDRPADTREGCKHRTMTRGHKCDYRKQIHEELLDSAVAEVIVKLVSNPKFAAMMQEKINMKVDTTAIEQEIANYEKQIRQYYSVKSKLIEEIDSIDPDDKHYYKRKADLDDRLYKMYDKIEDTENLLVAARAKKMAIEAEKLTGDNIYKVLIYFDKLYAAMNEQEKRQIMEALISEIQIYEERQPNGQWLKSIKFKLPIIEEDMSLSLDNDKHVETVVLLSRKNG